jgi:hypothetical protein
MRSAQLLLAAVAPMLAIGSRTAVADPVTSRVLTTPTAWVPPAGAVIGTAGVDHRGKGGVVLGYGFGGIAMLELGADTDVRTCTDCSERPTARWLPRAAFRLGAPQDAWFRGMPAVAVGVRNTFGARGFGPFEDPRVTEAYVVASRVVGPVRLHAGAEAVTAAFANLELAPVVRPIGGFEWTPAQYPKTTLMGDLAWTARLEHEADPAHQGPQAEWLAGWGVRYQALTWGSIELAVRHREAEGLAGSTVLVRVNGMFAPGIAKSRAAAR